jgi:hypothetical protein
MLKCCHAVLVCSIGLAFGAATLCVTGCGSQQAGATANGPVTGSPLEPADSSASGASATKPAQKLRPGARTKVLARAGDRPYDKTFDDLRFDMKVGEPFHRSMLTKPIEAMAGQKIRIRGYILPTAQKSGIRQFVLVRDNQECCFGQGAALYDCILVDMRPGATTQFSIRPVAAEGIFDIREFVVGGKHLAIYHMDAESVQ